MKLYNLEAAFQEGIEEALEEVIHQYGHALLRYCHQILCDYHEAQDAVQMTFLKAYDQRKSFQPGTSMSAWLRRIAYTTCIDLVRKRKLLLFEAPSHQTSDTMSEDCRKALRKISASDRALLYGRIMEERSYAELSRIHNKSETALRKQFERAKKAMAKYLKETNEYYARLEEQK